jgi:holo-[acyl-carrier protein] synthase
VILGIGIDLIEIARIERAMQNPRFIERILTPRERETPLTVERLAGRWAAKEAVAKAVGRSLNWHDVEITNEPSGGPCAVVEGGVLPPAAHILISISHEKGHAVAMAIIES